jgi:hypothetical protein
MWYSPWPLASVNITFPGLINQEANLIRSQQLYSSNSDCNWKTKWKCINISEWLYSAEIVAKCNSTKKLGLTCCLLILCMWIIIVNTYIMLIIMYFAIQLKQKYNSTFDLLCLCFTVLHIILWNSLIHSSEYHIISVEENDKAIKIY